MSIYKGNRVIAGTYPLYGTTGESNDGAMTQKSYYGRSERES